MKKISLINTLKKTFKTKKKVNKKSNLKASKIKNKKIVSKIKKALIEMGADQNNLDEIIKDAEIKEKD